MANNKRRSAARRRRSHRRSSGGLNTSYLTKMGFNNLIANRSMTLSSVSVLTVCLLLIGVSILLLLNIRTLVRDVEKQNVVVVFVKNGVEDAELNKINTDLWAIDNVTNVEFISKENGYEEIMEQFGLEQQMLDGVIENPLPDSYRVTVSNIDEFDATLSAINQVENVDLVRESREIVNQITTLQSSITAICFILVAVLTVVSLFIIANTIRITMVSRKIDIQVMKSVGATNLFICWPFMVEGVVIGLISGVTALILTYVVQVTEGDSLSSLFGLFGSTTVSVSDILVYLIFGYTLAGMVLGSFGSVVSIRKYLRKEGSEASEIV